ncbi:hypothetical protein H0H93_003018 [Arthromyces matolae]|nr:hypothetical protein H0H93_003018 [Arthromyces matolae]
MDNPNHGRSAVLNRALLESDDYREKCEDDNSPVVSLELIIASGTPMDVARAAYALLATTSHGVDFTKRKLVIVSQSGGSNGV